MGSVPLPSTLIGGTLPSITKNNGAVTFNLMVELYNKMDLYSTI